MASNEEQERKISDIYDEGMAIFEDIAKSTEATNSNDIQILVKKSMRLFEDATRLVSLAGLFSSNESIDEVATKDVRYLLLPALLGTLSLKLCVENRVNVVETADVYFRDFLKRCKNYEIIDFEVPEPKQDDEAESGSVQPARPACMPDLATMARERNAKIQRYKEQKELENQLDDLKKAFSSMDIVDEELERKYYITLIKNYASQAVDELQSLEAEKSILKYMAKERKDGTFANSEKTKKSKRPPPKPLQPIIITRDEVQKKVFGAGYPSLPTMTVQEFYDKKIKDGEWPDPSKQKPSSLLDMAASGQQELQREQEEIEKEERAERDDPKLLQETRDFDEFKDDHRRGWGNRMNRS